MKSVWEKLNLKDQSKLMILNAPKRFDNEINKLKGVDIIRDKGFSHEVAFFLFFVSQKAQIGQIASEILTQTQGDIIVWFSYPKGTSKRYSCDFNRDNGWDALFDLGFTGVRQIAIDEDWSSLRFRRRDFVKSKR